MTVVSVSTDDRKAFLISLMSVGELICNESVRLFHFSS